MQNHGPTSTTRGSTPSSQQYCQPAAVMASSASATTITSLPTELVQAIARDCDKADVLSLRLACRDSNAKVEDVFLDRFFTKRQHLMTVYSLNALVEICRIARFRRKVQELELVPVDLNSDYTKDFDIAYEPLLDPVEGQEAFPRLFHGDWSQLPDARKDKVNLANDTKKCVWNKWAAQWKSLVDDGLASKLIHAALLSLTCAGIIPTLIIRSDVSPAIPDFPYGFNQLHKAFGIKAGPGDIMYAMFAHAALCRGTSRATTIAPCVLEALASSAFPVQKLVLDGPEDGYSIACFSVDHALLPALSSVFANLQTLQMSTPASDDQQGLAGFSSLMQAATQLRTLQLDLPKKEQEFWGRGRASLEQIANAMPENRLECVKIHQGRIFANELIRFLGNQSKTLRAIEFTEMCAATDEDWVSIILHITGTLQLQKARLARLYRDEWRFRLQESDALDASGLEEIKKGLMLLAETAEFEPVPESEDEFDDEEDDMNDHDSNEEDEGDDIDSDEHNDEEDNDDEGSDEGNDAGISFE